MVLNEIEFDGDFFNSFLTEELSEFGIAKATASNLRIEMPSIFSLTNQAITLFLGIVDIRIDSVLGRERISSDKNDQKNNSYGLAQNLVDNMRVKFESVNISFEIDSKEQNLANRFIFKLYFFNSILARTNQNFKQTAIKEINSKLGDYILIHKMLKTRLAFAELYYLKPGDETMSHIVLFGNQSLDLTMIVKKNQNGVKHSIINALKFGDIALKLNYNELKIIKEFGQSLSPSKNQINNPKNPENSNFDNSIPSFPNLDKNLQTLFGFPPFLAPKKIDPMIDKPIFASNISINSLLLYVIPNKDLSQNSQFQTKVDESLRTLSNISSEKTENFDFDFKIFIDEVHFGVLNVNNHSVLPICFFAILKILAKEEKFGKFKEKKTSLSAKDIFVFIAENELETKNSDLVKIKCIFSTLQNNQQSLENQENCGNSDISLEKPLFFWNKENANFLNLKIFKRTPLLQPSTKSVKDNVFGDLKIKKMSICFDILDVVERFKMLSGNKFNYRKMKNFIVYFKNGDLEEKFSSKENEFVFRFLLEDLEFVVYNKMKKFAEIQLNNLKFSNQKNLLISSRNRKLITPFLNLDKFGQISRELNFDQIKLSFKQNCLKLSKTVFGHYSDEENLVLAFFNENFDVKMAECFSADDSVVFMKEKMEKLNFTPEKILETFKESDYVKNGIENLIRFLNEKENWNLGKFTNLLKFGQNAFSEKILKFFKQNFKQISENVNLTKPKIFAKNKQFLIFENKNLAVQTKLGKLDGCFRSENNLIFYDRSNDYSRFRCSSNKMNLKTPKSNFEKQFFLLKMNKNGENFENNFDLSFSYQPDSFLHSINLLKEQIQIHSNFVSDKNKPAKFDEKALKTAEEKVFGQEIESVLELERKINELKEQILMKDIVIKNYERQLENAFEELNNNIRNKNNNS